jgi:hypothetical protein
VTALPPKGDGCKAEGAANGDPIGKPDNAADTRFGCNPQGRRLGGRIAALGQLVVEEPLPSLPRLAPHPAKPPARPRDSMRQVPAISE